MAINWQQVDLIGTKNGVNTAFTLPDVPDGVTLLIVFNGRFLYRTGSPGPGEYFQAGDAITLGLAPNAADHVWAFYSTTGVVLTAGSVPFAQRRDFYWVVELRNKDGALIEILQKDVFQLTWQYSTVGGCGECEIALRREFDNYRNIDLDYEVRIWRDIDPLGVFGVRLPAVLPIQLGTTFAGARELRYSGFVRDIQPVLDEKESVRLRCSGYSRQLEYLVVPNQTYTNMDCGEIAREIIDTYALPGSLTQRTSALALVQDSGVTVESVRFDTSVFEALKSLAEIGGNCEWGVRADKEIYFTPRQNTVRQTYLIGDRIKLYESRRSSDDIVNRVFLRGASGFAATLTHPTVTYQTGFQKERVVFAPYISMASDATLWGLSYFSRFGASQPKGRLNLAAGDFWIENVGNPSGLLRVLGGPLFIGGGTALPAQLPIQLAGTIGAVTDQSFRVASITYQPKDSGLQADIELGERSNAMSDLFRTIEFKLSDLRQALL